MNSSEERLAGALRDLAASMPNGAGPEVRARVRAAFVRNRSRRRRRRIALTGGVVACLLLLFAWWQPLRLQRPTTVAKESPKAQPAVTSPPAMAGKSEELPVLKVATVRASGTHARRKSAEQSRGARGTELAATRGSDFVALPTFDPSIPTGTSRMVRMNLPGSALQLIGYPVDEELLERRVLTDVLVGQDGTPYAVRLVQTRSSH
jgi:hypothetical protein